MNSPGRFVPFLVIVLSVWTLMHIYVFGRILSVPAIMSVISKRTITLLASVLWILYPLARTIARRHPSIAEPLEILGSVWIGVIFLMLVWLFAADLLTGFGRLRQAAIAPARIFALGIAGVLSLFSLVQASREPAVKEFQVRVKNLRPEHEGLNVILLSDMHLGSVLGEKWLEKRVQQVKELQPDLIALAGDIVEDPSSVTLMLPRLKELRARLGVYAVNGNHEFYAGLDRSVAIFKEAGFKVLRDEWQEAAPGLILAGVDDLTARQQFAISGDGVRKALSGRPAGATILLSHTPWEVEKAAELGADLMLSAHTHGGQIWPFIYLVRLRYRYLAGQYDVNGMPLIITRGTGFWGPPMRLFARSEIVKVTLNRF